MPRATILVNDVSTKHRINGSCVSLDSIGILQAIQIYTLLRSNGFVSM